MRSEFPIKDIRQKDDQIYLCENKDLNLIFIHFDSIKRINSWQTEAANNK